MNEFMEVQPLGCRHAAFHEERIEITAVRQFC
jgi:hypothetical protein